MIRNIIAILLLACVSICPAAAVVRDTADEDVDRAIEAVKRYLWAQQDQDGSWTKYGYATRYHLPGGFVTALVTYALLEAGESIENEPRMKRAVDALAKFQTKNLRVRALRIMALSRVVGADKGLPYRGQLKKDLKWLLRGRGKWGDSGPEKVGDNSCNQYALMAMEEASRAGIEIPSRMIRLAERTWIERQRKDGGWAFAGLESMDMKSTPRMTAAGLASMFYCQNALSNACSKYRHQKALNKAWDYLSANFKEGFLRSKDSNSSYNAFCVQRVGMANGRKFLANIDWYAVAAADLAEPKPFGRSYTGYWGRLVRAGFELIVLARGRLPLTFNKLEWGEGGDWNFHPRDIAQFSEFMRRHFERPMRWQIVKITDDVRTMLDTPIMLVAGKKALDLTPDQWKLLREYTLRGGTLLFVPIHDSLQFLDSAKKALKDLYLPQGKLAGNHYEFQRLPADHPLYNLHTEFPGGPGKIPMWGVSDGTRLLAVICGKDMTCAWQKRAFISRKLDFMLGVNFFMYTTGQNSISSRLRPVFSGGSKREVRHTAKVARLKHNGNWCTQPYGLNYLSQKLTAENRVAIKITSGVPATKEALQGQHLVWVTGSDKFSLSSEELSALREYLTAGGTMFVNAVGGSKEFNHSAQEMLEALFKGQNVVSGYITEESSLMTGKCGDFRGPKLERLSRTRSFKMAIPKAPAVMRVYKCDGRVLTIHVRFGVHDTLDGHTVHGAKSYMPSSARDIAANVVLYSLVNAQNNSTDLPPEN